MGKLFYGKIARLRPRYNSTSASQYDNIRNIAILAHIDAGTEYILFIL